LAELRVVDAGDLVHGTHDDGVHKSRPRQEVMALVTARAAREEAPAVK
jgi:hypothetical protein